MPTCKIDLDIDFIVDVVIPRSSSHEETRTLGEGLPGHPSYGGKHHHKTPYVGTYGNYDSKAKPVDGAMGHSVKNTTHINGIPSNFTPAQKEAVKAAVDRQIGRWMEKGHYLPGVPKNVNGNPPYLVGSYKVDMHLPGMEVETDCGGGATAASGGGTAGSRPIEFKDDRDRPIPFIYFNE